jgi:hypothetical protein
MSTKRAEDVSETPYCGSSSRSERGNGDYSEDYDDSYRSPVRFSGNPLSADPLRAACCTPTGTPTRPEQR